MNNLGPSDIPLSEVPSTTVEDGESFNSSFPSGGGESPGGSKKAGTLDAGNQNNVSTSGRLSDNAIGSGARPDGEDRPEFFEKWQNHIGFSILALAYCFIYPGLWWPTCRVHTGIFATKAAFERSTLQLVKFLYNSGPRYYPPALLLAIFSVSLPFVKGFLIVIGVATKSAKLLWFVARISKFQFVDTFSTFLSFVYLNNPAVTTELKSGVYYFLGYCVLSVIGTQIICFGYDTGRRKSVTTLWFPVAVIQVVSLVALYFVSPIMGVSAVLWDIRLIGKRDTLREIIFELNPICGWMMVITICIMPIVTYVILPVLVRFCAEKPGFEMLGSKKRLFKVMDFCHDWAMADVLFIAYLVAWMSFNAADEVATQALPVGTYFTVLYGISGSVMMFIFEYNAQLTTSQLTLGDGVSEERILDGLAELNEHSGSGGSARNMISRETVEDRPTLQQWCRPRSKTGRIIRYCVLLVVGLVVPAIVLQTLQHSEKPPVADVHYVNEMIKRSPLFGTVNGMFEGKKITSSLACCKDTSELCTGKNQPPDPCTPIDTKKPSKPLTVINQGALKAIGRWITGLENTRLRAVKLIPYKEDPIEKRNSFNDAAVAAAAKNRSLTHDLPTIDEWEVISAKSTSNPSKNIASASTTASLNANRKYDKNRSLGLSEWMPSFMQWGAKTDPVKPINKIKLQVDGELLSRDNTTNITLPLSLKVETTAVVPITWFDNTNSCCGPQKFTLVIQGECHPDAPYIRNLKTGDIAISPPITISEEVLGFKFQVTDITDKVKDTLSNSLNELIQTVTIPIGETRYNITGLINTIVSANLLPGDPLECPTDDRPPKEYTGVNLSATNFRSESDLNAEGKHREVEAKSSKKTKMQEDSQYYDAY